MVWNLFGYDEGRGQEATEEQEEQEASSEKTKQENKEWTFGIFREVPTTKETAKQTNTVFIQSKNIVKAKRLVEEKIYQKDYVTNCTSLYKKIEEEDWSSVATFLETGKWPGHFFTDPICPDVQVRTWIKRSDPTNSQNLLWRQLPLHLAIVVAAPYGIIRRLVEMYPESVRCTDSQRHLPVHNAMRHGNSDRVVDYLLSAFPAASESTCLRNDSLTTLGCILQAEEGGIGMALSSALHSPSYSSQQLSTRSSDETSQMPMRSSSDESSQLHVVGSTTTRTSVSMWSQMSRASEEMIEDLKLRLERKESELGVVQSRLDELNKTKADIEEELAQKMQKLKCSQSEIFDDPPDGCQGVEAAMLIGIIKIQQRLIVLEAERHELELAQQELKIEESDIQYHLERFQGSAVESTGIEGSVVDSTSDIESLKDEVKEVECRLADSHGRKEEAVSVIHTIPPDTRLSDAATKEDIRIMQRTIEELFRTTSLGTATKDEFAALKGEMDALRREVKDMEEAARLKVDLILLGNALERNLNNMKGEKQLADAKAAMKSVEARSLETRSIDQLRVLKTKLELIMTEFVVNGTELESEISGLKESSGSTVQRKQSSENNGPTSPRALKEAALSIDTGLLTSGSTHQVRAVTHQQQLLSQTSLRSQRSQTSFPAPRRRYRLRAASLPKDQSPKIRSASSLPAKQSKRTTPAKSRSGRQ